MIRFNTANYDSSIFNCIDNVDSSTYSSQHGHDSYLATIFWEKFDNLKKWYTYPTKLSGYFDLILWRQFKAIVSYCFSGERCGPRAFCCKVIGILKFKMSYLSLPSVVLQHFFLYLYYIFFKVNYYLKQGFQ